MFFCYSVSTIKSNSKGISFFFDSILKQGEYFEDKRKNRIDTKDDTQMRKNLVKGGLILAIFSFLSKVIGVFYRIPLTNALGATGLGIYQLIFPVYALMVSLTSQALPVIVARTMPSYDEDLSNSFLGTVMRYAILAGFLSSALLIIIARPLSRLQGAEDAFIGYLAISPSLLFVPILSALRGWFNSRLDNFPTAISGVLEQLFKLSGVVGAYILSEYSATIRVAIALSGISLAELLTTLICFISFLEKGGKLSKKIKIPMKAITNSIMPLTIGGLIFPLTVFIDSILTVRLLTLNGLDETLAIGEYGILSGAVGAIINLPSTLALSFAVTVVPVIASAKRNRNIKEIKNGESNALKWTLLICLPCVSGIIALAPEIVHLFYSSLSESESSLATFLMRISTAQIIPVTLLQIYGAYLQALDKSITSTRNMLIGGVVKILLDFSVIFIGISGIVLANFVCFALCGIMNGLEVRRLTGRVKNTSFVKITLCSLLLLPVLLFAKRIKANILWQTAFSVLLGGISYVIMLIVSGVFSLNRPNKVKGQD